MDFCKAYSVNDTSDLHDTSQQKLLNSTIVSDFNDISNTNNRNNLSDSILKMKENNECTSNSPIATTINNKDQSNSIHNPNNSIHDYDLNVSNLSTKPLTAAAAEELTNFNGDSNLTQIKSNSNWLANYRRPIVGPNG